MKARLVLILIYTIVMLLPISTSFSLFSFLLFEMASHKGSQPGITNTAQAKVTVCGRQAGLLLLFKQRFTSTMQVSCNILYAFLYCPPSLFPFGSFWFGLIPV